MDDLVYLSKQELDDDRALLDQLFEEVREEVTTLAGGEKLPASVEAIQKLRQSSLSLGDPTDQLVHLTPELFESLGITLNAIQQAQLSEFDFYHLSLPVSLIAQPGAVFKEVDCRLDLGSTGRAIVQALFPEARWREVLKWGGQMSLALDSDLRWQVGVAPEALAQVSAMDGVPVGQIKNQNDLSAHIVVPSYTFTLGRYDIAATGEGNNFAQWRLSSPELQEKQTLRFVVLFKVPQGTEAIELTALAAAQPNMQWLTSHLGHIFSELSARLRQLLTGERWSPVADSERWTLKLPRRAATD